AAVDADGLRGEVERDRTALQGRLAPAGGAADQRIEPCQQFLDVEGFDQVVVGALLEALDLVLPARARGQDQHRELLAFLAQRLDQFHARHLRQAEVDDAQVERHLAAHVQAFLAVLRRVDGETFALQAGGQGLAQRGFVFNQQDAHGYSLYGSVGAAEQGPLAGSWTFSCRRRVYGTAVAPAVRAGHRRIP